MAQSGYDHKYERCVRGRGESRDGITRSINSGAAGIKARYGDLRSRIIILSRASSDKEGAFRTGSGRGVTRNCGDACDITKEFSGNTRKE